MCLWWTPTPSFSFCLPPKQYEVKSPFLPSAPTMMHWVATDSKAMWSANHELKYYQLPITVTKILKETYSVSHTTLHILDIQNYLLSEFITSSKWKNFSTWLGRWNLNIFISQRWEPESGNEVCFLDLWQRSTKRTPRHSVLHNHMLFLLVEIQNMKYLVGERSPDLEA